MLGGDELEIKMSIGIDTLILSPGTTQVITDITEEALDYAVFKKLPGICGYIVKSGDTLWDVAKKYYNAVAAEDFRIGEIRYEGPFLIAWDVGYGYFAMKLKSD